MGKTSTEVKNRYNKKAYSRHEFTVRKDDLLDEKIKKYKEQGSLSDLIKELLENHFKENEK